MTAVKVFPTVLIALSAIAALIYATQGDLKLTVYWAAAAALNFSVTWL